MTTLRNHVLALGASAAACTLSVALEPLDGGPGALRIEADRVVHAASTMKVAVLVELYRRAAAGDLRLGDLHPVRNRFASVVDGSPYALSPADDSETRLYGRVGGTAPLEELARLAITESSNLATNLLVDFLGARAITATMDSLGLHGLVVRRGVEDQRAFDAGISNTVTAADLARLLVLLGRGEVVTPEASAAMVAILEQQSFRDGIPAGLPAGVRVANKTGSISRLYHDAALVLPAGRASYVLVVLTTGLDAEREGPALVAAVSRAVWEDRRRVSA